MPRPRKCRHICCHPPGGDYGPLGPCASDDGKEASHADVIRMAVDEFETIRLIDLLGLTQEECAAQMRVARTTVQRMYTDGRRKIADALVNGRTLRIEGGDVLYCDGDSGGCKRPDCCRREKTGRCGE